MGVFCGNTEYEDHFRYWLLKKFLEEVNRNVETLVVAIENIKRLKLFQLGGKGKII